jgi:hypothetical protein
MAGEQPVFLPEKSPLHGLASLLRRWEAGVTGRLSVCVDPASLVNESANAAVSSRVPALLPVLLVG